MSPEQIALVKSSFEQVRPIAQQAAELFYDRLFELDPELKPLFKRDIKEQARMLMSVLSVAVASLDRIDTLLPTLHDMGARHAGYGVKEEHYATVGQALLWTLGYGLGGAFTPAVKEAWTVAYSALAGAMMYGARRAEPMKQAA